MTWWAVGMAAVGKPPNGRVSGNDPREVPHDLFRPTPRRRVGQDRDPDRPGDPVGRLPNGTRSLIPDPGCHRRGDRGVADIAAPLLASESRGGLAAPRPGPAGLHRPRRDMP